MFLLYLLVAMALTWALAVAIGRLEVRFDPKLEWPHVSGAGVQLAASALLLAMWTTVQVLDALGVPGASGTVQLTCESALGEAIFQARAVALVGVVTSPLASLTIGIGRWAVGGVRPKLRWTGSAYASWFVAARCVLEADFFPTV